jgi:predicted DNA-binding transcriptional regulator YafY
MAKFKPQYRRLLFIDREIREGRYPNCRSLAAVWEVNAKTIQRDVEYLKYELGAPVEYDALRHGFRYSEPNFRLPAIQISESDLFAVCIAQKALKQFEKTPLYDKLASVFEKIEQALPDRVTVHPGWVDGRISFIPDARTRMEPGIWEDVANALRGNLRVRLSYQSPGRETASDREVDPYHLVNYKGEWYLIGYAHAHGEIRTYAVSRVRRVDILREKFELPPDFDLARLVGDHFGIMWGDTPYTVRVRFDRRLAPYIGEREWHPRQKVRRGRDGSVVLEFQTNHLNEVKDWVLSWGAGARALAPRKLVDKIRRDLRDALSSYDAAK